MNGIRVEHKPHRTAIRSPVIRKVNSYRSRADVSSDRDVLRDFSFNGVRFGMRSGAVFDGQTGFSTFYKQSCGGPAKCKQHNGNTYCGSVGAIRTRTAGQADGRLARNAAAVPATLVLGVTGVVGSALFQARPVQRADVVRVKVADRTLARLNPPLVHTAAVTLPKNRLSTAKFGRRVFCVVRVPLCTFYCIEYFYAQRNRGQKRRQIIAERTWHHEKHHRCRRKRISNGYPIIQFVQRKQLVSIHCNRKTFLSSGSVDSCG